ncbi:unnamed protein product [Acanthosepion pharaonis]|uniref:Ig-like domain-containing protein n=1 Tax=Acanthosepion pharaonis TaxID=158019 RepID=A0A812DG12_ACAPH|nr:unnamed protein product [Sepia pharaonis]
MEVLFILHQRTFIVLLLLYLTEGQSVTLNMPSHTTLNSKNVRITCEFQTDDQFTSMTLLNGNNDLVATYSLGQQTFTMHQGSSVRLEVGSGTTFKGGSLTFLLPRFNCPDFTWYVCRGSGSNDGTPSDSTNITLQISPSIDSFMKTSTSDLVANQLSSFECRGTVRKEGPFSVKWYRKTITSSSQLQVDPAKIIDQNECSRSISSSINYNVSETDGPNLVLRCRIESGQRNDKMVNFTVQEMSKIAAPFMQQPVKGAAVTLKMPSYTTLNSVNMRITCEFPNDDHLVMITLLSGNKATEATYVKVEKTSFIKWKNLLFKITARMMPARPNFGIVSSGYSSILHYFFSLLTVSSLSYVSSSSLSLSLSLSLLSPSVTSFCLLYFSLAIFSLSVFSHSFFSISFSFLSLNFLCIFSLFSLSLSVFSISHSLCLFYLFHSLIWNSCHPDIPLPMFLLTCLLSSLSLCLHFFLLTFLSSLFSSVSLSCVCSLFSLISVSTSLLSLSLIFLLNYFHLI